MLCYTLFTVINFILVNVASYNDFIMRPVTFKDTNESSNACCECLINDVIFRSSIFSAPGTRFIPFLS